MAGGVAAALVRSNRRFAFSSDPARSRTGGSGNLLSLLVIVLLGCVSCVLVVGMIPLDRLFIPLGRSLRRFGGCKVGYTVSHWVSVVQPVMYHPSQGMVAKWDHLSTCQRMSAFKLRILTNLSDVDGTADSAY